MSADINEFYSDFFQEIVGHSETGQFMENAFTEVYCEYLIDAGEFDTFDGAYYKAAKGMKIDGYAGDPAEFDGVLTLVISDFNDSDKLESLTRTQVETLFKRLVNFYKACLKEDFHIRMEETSSGYGLAELISNRQHSISRVRLFLLSNRLLSDRVTGMEEIEIAGKPVTYNVWDISRLHRLVASRKGKEEIEIDLVNEFGDGLPCLPAHVSGDAYEAYLTVVPGPMLAALYDRWGARLLEQNVRCFLQARGNVNKGIRNTIINDPDMFFAYNNGVTATAESVDISAQGGVTRITSLRNLQIVNGGQTTASIFTAQKKDKAELDHIFVQMKLSVVDPEQAEKVVPKISEYANSQNRVNAADFFANHPFHIRMEEYSRRIWARSPEGTFRDTKWFYERARGQYLDAKANLSPAEKKRFDSEHPKAQSFTKTDLAKFENVWECIPHIVSKGAQANFAHFAKLIGKRWDSDPDQFNEQYFQHAMARALLFRRLEKLVSQQDWYDGGYRANIVAYSISKLAHLIMKTGKVLDFGRIWQEQKLPGALEDALLKVAGVVHKNILATPDGIRNISEWAKKEACWKRIEELDITLPGTFEKDLISKSEAIAEKTQARKLQKIDNGIEAQKKVLELGAGFWSNSLNWAKQNNVLTEKDWQIMAVATSIPRKLPTDKQSIYLTGLLDKLADEACPYIAELQ
jgi:AIPR protein/Abortive infection phage resistance protein N-terminal domain